MRCPACHAVNAEDADRCSSCNKAFARKPARRRNGAEEPNTPAAQTVASNRAALSAYRLSLIGLIPLAGLVLGPVAIALGAWAAYRGRKDPAFTARGPVIAAVILGVLDTLTNWGGVVLMALGLPVDVVAVTHGQAPSTDRQLAT